MKNIPILFVTILASSSFAFGPAAHAELSFKAGVVDINVSGSDGGGGAGDVTLNLSYTDNSKTQIKLEGQTKQGSKVKAISQVVPVAGLKQIAITAIGGDGYNGSSGSDGSDGWRGNDGWSGCPPSDGSDGRDGGDGGNGGSGGDGGRGGNIKISVSAAESEILLLVKTTSEPGQGGSGGSGGRGGSGGNGGRGGQNTCKDDKGNPTNGRNGQDGRDGRNGSSGSSGSSGRNGRQGSESFELIDGSNTQSFNRTFGLTINSVKTLDENEDGVLQPGESLSVTEITISNKGPMPSPKGQLINLVLQNSSTLTVLRAPAIAVQEQIAGGATKVLTFAKGEVLMKAPDNVKLIGEEAKLVSVIGINNIALQNTDEAGIGIHWPVAISAAASRASLYFKNAKDVNFAIKNVGRQNVGPQGDQPVEVDFEWVSKTVPGSDVSVTMKDGRTFKLDKLQAFNDFSIPAKSSLAVGLSVNIDNSKNVLTGSGTLKVTLKLKDFSSDGQDAVDSSTTAINLAVDLRGVRISKHFELDQPEIRCNYPESFSKSAKTTGIDIAKDKGSDKVRVQITTDGFLSHPVSPVLTISAFDFATYGNLVKSNSTSLIISFLNGAVAPATRALQDRSWVMQKCGLVQQ